MKKFILQLLFHFFSLYGICQAPSMGFPNSFKQATTNTLGFRQSLSQLLLPSYNNTVIEYSADSIEALCSTCDISKKYFGKGIPQNNTDLKSSAHYHNTNIDSSEVWIYKIKSPTAIGLQAYFSKFIIPPGASLFAYNLSKTIVFGPYTSVNTPPDTSKKIHFGTPLIQGGEIFLEYSEPLNVAFSGTIQINNIIHAFREMSGGGIFGGPSANCQTNVACYSAWTQQAKAVAIITVYDNLRGYIGNCTGTLLDNTSHDGEGYFITASHCIPIASTNTNITSWDPSTWQFYFDYQQPNCNDSYNFTFNKIVFGATILAQDPMTYTNSNYSPSNSDYLLLKLNTTKESLKHMNLCFAGWESASLTSQSTPTSTSFALIHHPLGDYKKIAFGNNLRNANSYNYSSLNMFTIDYSIGVSEAVSSGAALFNPNKQIVATHSGRKRLVFVNNNVCNTSGPYPDNYYTLGKFSRHWTLGSFAQWLDPLNVITSTNTAINGTCFIPTGSSPTLGPPGYANQSYTASTINQGITINAQSGIPLVCDGNTINQDVISITPLIGNKFFVNTHEKEEPCGFMGSNLTPGSGIYVVNKVLGVPTKCARRYYTTFKTIEKLNYDFSPTGIKYSRSDESIAFGEPWLVSGFSFNMPSSSFSIEPGNYYRVTVETSENSGYNFGEAKFFAVSQNLIITNKIITQSAFAQNTLTILNSTISNSCDLIAGQEIKIQGETSIGLSHIFLQTINCQGNGYRPINQLVNYTESSQIISSLEDTYNTNTRQTKDDNELLKTQKELSNKIYPNPNKGNFIYELNYNNGGYMELTNIFGELIFKANVNSFEINKEIKVSNPISGVYFFSYYDRFDKLVETKKIIFSD